jgi:hypothetical protein
MLAGCLYVELLWMTYTVHYHSDLLAMLLSEDVVEQRRFTGAQIA